VASITRKLETAQHLDDHQQQEERDGSGRDRLVFPVPVGMVRVRRLAGRADADQADHVRRGVGKRVESVGKNADRAGGVAEGDLRCGDRDVQEQDAKEDAGDLGVTP
jgi:hypothetical protein